MKYTISILLSAVLIGLSTNSTAAPPLSTRDVAAHCGAELEAMAPGSAAKIKAMSDADFEKWDKVDTTMQMINAPDMTPTILQDLIQSTRDDKWDPYDTSKEKVPRNWPEIVFTYVNGSCGWIN